MDRSQAVIEFKLDGTILRANANFLSALGYTAAEIEGRRHSMFVPAAEAAAATTATSGRDLNRGEFVARKFLRIGKGGQARSGSRPPTIPCSTQPASPTRSSSSPPTSRPSS
jgi:methyl-accepting chemotaxis protein